MRAQSLDTFERMERMYRPQQRIYDLTRAYYLLGRDRCIREMQPDAGAHILDVGCGTGRNLAALRRNYPNTSLAGLDPSDAMLEVAAQKSKDWQAVSRPQLLRNVAEDLPAIIGSGSLGRPDHILFSYSLSIMPEPVQALASALSVLAPGGRIHIVDFGPMHELPRWFARSVQAWLERFDVRHKPDVSETLQTLHNMHKGSLQTARPLRGYCEILHYTKSLDA